MAKVDYKILNSYVENNQTNIFFFCGKDRLFINNIIDQFLFKYLGADYYKKTLTTEKLLENPAILSEEFFNLNFFSTNKTVLFIDNPQDFLVNQFKHISGEGNIIIIRADTRVNSINLCKFVESNKKFLFVSCYNNNKLANYTFIQEKISANDFVCSKEILNSLLSLLPEDTTIIDKELDKLFLFMGDRKTIEKNDLDIVNDSNFDNSINNLVHYICQGELSNAYSSLFSLLDKGVKHSMIVRYIARYFFYLNSFKASSDRNYAKFKEVLASDFFCDFNKFKLYTSKFESAFILNSFLAAHRCEQSIKKDPNINTNLLVKCIIHITKPLR